jgi:DNA-binding transcriptional MerR regulator
MFAAVGEDELISIGEAARILGLTPGTLRRWDQAKKGPRPIRSATNQRRYRRGDVEAEAEGRRDRPDQS